jgi:hypothetical protein
MKTESRCVLSEANEKTKKVSKDEIDEKIKIWSNAQPPMKLTMPLFPFSLDLQEKIIIVRGKHNVNGINKSFTFDDDDDDYDESSTDDDEKRKNR